MRELFRLAYAPLIILFIILRTFFYFQCPTLDLNNVRLRTLKRRSGIMETEFGKLCEILCDRKRGLSTLPFVNDNDPQRFSK